MAPFASPISSSKEPSSFTGLGMLSVDAVSSACLLVTAVNPLPVYGMYKDMNSKGKIINGAFIVCAGTLLGDHLGFTAGVQPDYIFPVMAGKLCGGILSLILAFLMTRNIEQCNKQNEKKGAVTKRKSFIAAPSFIFQQISP